MRPFTAPTVMPSGSGPLLSDQNADGTITKVRETGGEFEKIFARIAPERFNNDQTAGRLPRRRRCRRCAGAR
jgi:hypothetical protein